MKKTIAALAFATMIASPAFAQSYNPDVGTGNIAAQSTISEPRLSLDLAARGAYAQVGHGARVIEHSFGRGSLATDPDANIRFQLNRESEQGRW